MANLSRKNLESAKKLVNDPGWRYAVAIHTFLNRMYRGLSKEQRYAMYREAGIYKSLEGARKRVEVKRAMSNRRFSIRLGAKEIRSCARYLLTSSANIDPKTKLGIRVMRNMALAALSIRRNSVRRQRAEASR